MGLFRHKHEDDIWVVVNNELVCVNRHAQEDYDIKKEAEKKHKEDQITLVVNNEFIHVDKHH